MWAQERKRWSWVVQCTPVTSALRRQRQEELCGFKARPDNIERSYLKKRGTIRLGTVWWGKQEKT